MPFFAGYLSSWRQSVLQTNHLQLNMYRSRYLLFQPQCYIELALSNRSEHQQYQDPIALQIVLGDNASFRQTHVRQLRTVAGAG